MLTDEQIYFLTGKFIIGTLFFIRIAGFIASSPMFKSEAIPGKLKIFFAVMLATTMSAAFWEDQPTIDFHLWFLVLLVLKEFMVGLIIGFASSIVFWGARFAGGMLDFSMGYHTSVMFLSQDTPTLLGNLKELMCLMIFFAINGHHYLIEGIFISIRAVPISTFEITASTYLLLLELSKTMLIIGLKMSAPTLISLFLTNFALALLARVAPQTNIFILSFQVKIMVGLLILFSSISLFALLAKSLLYDVDNQLIRFILTLNPIRV